MTADLDVPVAPARLYPYIGDLARYPDWLGIVERARPIGDGVWNVDLRGRLGPFARSKRLRMVRTAQQPDRLATFERVEDDGRMHAAWVLRANLRPTESGCRLTMDLAYSGTLAGPIIERMLRDEIELARPRLTALVTGDGDSRETR